LSITQNVPFYFFQYKAVAVLATQRTALGILLQITCKKSGFSFLQNGKNHSYTRKYTHRRHSTRAKTALQNLPHGTLFIQFCNRVASLPHTKPEAV